MKEISPSAKEYLLFVKDDSMFPVFKKGDRVVVCPDANVESGAYAVVLCGAGDAALRKIRYGGDNDWLELIPVNPEYPPRRIHGRELECCYILGRVVKLIRDID